MTNNLSIVQLLLHASWVVQAVVALLVLGSIASWAAIFRKLFALKKVVRSMTTSSATSGQAPA
jgi:biopolymer transport protein TolQ